MHASREAGPALGLLRTAFAVVVLLAVGGAWAQPATVLWYQSDSQAPVRRQAPPDTFSVSATPAGVSARFNEAVNSAARLDLAPSPGNTFQVGAYEGAQDFIYPFLNGSLPGLGLLVGGGWYGGEGGGRFAVLETVYDSSFNLVSFAADFEIPPGDSQPRFYGELRINSAIPLTVDKPPGSTAPDPFAFTPRVQVQPSSAVVSNATTIYGINAPAPIAITGGEYSLNGGAFTASPGTASNRDRIQVRVIASASAGTMTGATLVIGGVAATFNVTTFTVGQPLTGLYFRNVPRELITGVILETLEGYAPAWNFSATYPYDRLLLRFDGPSGERYSLDLGPGGGAPKLAPGAYEEADDGYLPGVPAIDMFAFNNCSSRNGRFVVLEADFGPGSTVNRFAANFEMPCHGPSLFGEVRFNSAVPFSYMKPPATTLPEPFAFNAQSPVRPGARVLSNQITIYGVTAPVPISVTGGEYSVNGGTFTSAPGTAQNLDHIVVRLLAPGTPGAVVSATLNAGGRAATLSATTLSNSMSLTGVYYRSPSGDYIGAGETRAYLAPPNEILISPYNSGPSSVSFRVNGIAGVWLDLLIASPTGPLAVGAYEGAIRPTSGYGVPWLEFSGNGRGCNTLAGRFVVRDVAFSNGTVQRMAVDFEQRCEGTGPPLLGELRYNSSVPFSYLLADPATITSPAAGSTLAGSSQTFQWSDAAAPLYQVWVGSSPGAYDLGYYPTIGTANTFTTISGLPTDGRTLYVRLYSLLGGTTYHFRDFVYTAANLIPVPATIAIPANGSTLAGASQVFQWNAAPGATLYQVWVGNSVGAYDIGYFPTTGTSGTTATITGLPTDGRTLYVRLYSNIGGRYYSRDFTYVAAAPATPTAAAFTVPSPGTTLGGATQTFQWNAAPGAVLYQVWVGNSVGAYDLGYFPTLGTTGTSTTVTGLPTDGRTLYVRLYSNIGGTYYYRDFTYTAFVTGSPLAATFTSPVNGSTLSGASQLFQWSIAPPGATLFQVWVGSSVGTYDLGYFPAAGTTLTSTLINGLPTDGRTLYVRLYSLIGGTYYYRDFTFQASH